MPCGRPSDLAKLVTSGLGGQPVHVAVHQRPVLAQYQFHEVDCRVGGPDGTFGVSTPVRTCWLASASRPRTGRRAPSRPGCTPWPRTDSPASAAAAQVVHRDGAGVQGVEDVQRPVRLLRPEVAARLVAVAVVQVPQQARPAPCSSASRSSRWRASACGGRGRCRPRTGPWCSRSPAACASSTYWPARTRRRTWRAARGRSGTGCRSCSRCRSAARSWRGTGCRVGFFHSSACSRGRHEPVHRVQGGDGVPGALLAVVAPGAADVGPGRVVLVDCLLSYQ